MSLVLYALLPVLLALGFTTPLAAQTLAQLEVWASAAAPEQRLAALEAEALEHRLQAVKARGSARLIGGASLADAEEAVTDTVVRDYRRGSVQLGVRWSLLAAAREREEATTATRASLRRARLREQEVTLTTVRLLRLAYVQAWYAGERLQLTERFLQGEPAAQRWLQRRTEEHLLLESDRLAFVSMFDAARRERAGEVAARDAALRSLQRFTGQTLAGFAPVAPSLHVDCVSLEQVRAAAAQRPAVALARAELDLRRSLLARSGAIEVDAGVSLAQSVSRDVGGPSGHASVVAIDFSMPLGSGPARDARRAEAAVELERAQLRLEIRLADDERETQRAQDALKVVRADLDHARRQFKGAFEAVRVARLRARSMEGDVLERELQTRYALYRAAIDVSRTRQRLDEAAVDWLALVPLTSCATTAAAEGGELSPDVLTALAGTSVVHKRTSADGLGWFIWQGEQWLSHDAPWQKLPSGTRRIALSFTSSQIARLTEPQHAQALHQLLRQARDRGIAVEWLLGEPTWVQPEGRPSLLALLHRLSGFAFDAVNLDLERSQLPEPARADWEDQVVATVGEVRKQGPWPVVLTTHHREFADAALVRRLIEVGLSEGVAMVYVSRIERAAEIARPLLRGPLPLAIAQSIEPELPPHESSAALGQRAALMQWQRLADMLADAPGFRRRDGAVLGDVPGGTTVKIRFDLPPGSAQESNGMAVRYAAAKRQVPRWRWYLLLALVIAPPLYFVLRFASSTWWETAPAFVTLQDVTVRAGARGRVASVTEPGALVRKGEPIGQLALDTPVVTTTRVPAAEARIPSYSQRKAAQAVLTLSERQAQMRRQRFDALRELVQEGAATAAELAAAQAQWFAAEGDRVRAQAELEALQAASQPQSVPAEDVEPRPVLLASPALGVAPIEGEVLRVFVRPGEWVEATTDVALLRGQSEPRITAYVDPAGVRYAQPGRRATLRFADGSRIGATVSSVAPEAQRLPPERVAPLTPRGQALVVELRPDRSLPQRYRIHNLPLDVRFEHVW